jgi:mRNA-degrading endonuclease RelE of RelBE toxin-antitoxin system
MATVRLKRGAQEDLAKLDGSLLSAIAKGLIKLRNSPDKRGEALRDELAGYRKLVIGSINFRIVYRYDSAADETVVVAIGRRRDEVVYKLAESRISDDPANGLGDVQGNDG